MFDMFDPAPAEKRRPEGRLGGHAQLPCQEPPGGDPAGA
jgi:hypothetical protein